MLGDLARYWMAVAAMVGGSVRVGGLSGQLMNQAVSEATSSTDQVKTKKSSNSTKSLSDRPAARIDDSPLPSIGVAAACMMDVELKKERWRQIAMDLVWCKSG